MPLAAKVSDKGTQHDGYCETVIIAGSSTVFMDGLSAARQGDLLTPHARPPTSPLHPNLNVSASCHAGNFSRYSRSAASDSSASIRVAWCASAVAMISPWGLMTRLSPR